MVDYKAHSSQMADMILEVMVQYIGLNSDDIIDLVVQRLVNKYGGQSLIWHCYSEEVFSDLFCVNKIGRRNDIWVVLATSVQYPTLRSGYDR